ncbi:hypothetical protein GQ457_09G013590 [Hibiscus cannabinus]
MINGTTSSNNNKIVNLKKEEGDGVKEVITQQPKSADKSKFECYHCHKYGHYHIHVLNRSPTFTVQNQTPEEAWSKYKPCDDRFKIFGCIAYAHVPDSKRGKLYDKGEKCIFLGVCEQSKVYKLYNAITKKIVISRVVVFNETNFLSNDKKNTYGYVFMLGSGDVSWSSKKKHIVTLSTTEAELVAAILYAYQTTWLNKILEELRFRK